MKAGLAADHGGFEMKQPLSKLIVAGDEVVDFGNKVYGANDDCPDCAISLARAGSRVDVERGVPLCGSAVARSMFASLAGEMLPKSAVEALAEEPQCPLKESGTSFPNARLVPMDAGRCSSFLHRSGGSC